MAPTPSAALTCALSADVFFTLMDISVMYLEVFEHVSTSQVLLVRMVRVSLSNGPACDES